MFKKREKSLNLYIREIQSELVSQLVSKVGGRRETGKECEKLEARAEDL